MVNYLQFTVHPPPLPQPFGDPLSLPLPASDVTAHGCSFVIECRVCPYKGLSSLGKCQTLIQVWPGYVRRSQKTSGSGCTFRTLNLGQRAKFRIVYKLTSIAGPLCTWKVWCLSVSHIVKIVVEKSPKNAIWFSPFMVHTGGFAKKEVQNCVSLCSPKGSPKTCFELFYWYYIRLHDCNLYKVSLSRIQKRCVINTAVAVHIWQSGWQQEETRREWSPWHQTVSLCRSVWRELCCFA